MSPIQGLYGVALIETALAAFVWARHPTRPVNRWFAAFAVNLALWATLVGVRRSFEDAAVVLVAVRVLWATAALIPVSFLHFTSVFPRREPGPTPGARVITATGLAFAGLACSPWFVEGVRPDGGVYLQPIYGPAFPAFALYFAGASAWSLCWLGRKLRHASGFARAQLHYVLIGAALTAAGGITLGMVVPLLTGTSRYGVYGPYVTLVWLGFTAHAIVRYRLMDIRVVVSRGAAYVLGWTVITAVLVGATVVLGRLVPAASAPMSPAGLVLLGLSASGLFVGLAPRLARLADRYLYRPAYDPGHVVRAGSRAMSTVADPARVASAMAELIQTALRVESVSILRGDAERSSLSAAVRLHVDPAVSWPTEHLTGSTGLARMLIEQPAPVLADEVGRLGRPGHQRVLADLAGWHAELAMPVRDDELRAVILVGRKLSGDSFFENDLDLLETLASELAVGLHNADLYRQVASMTEYSERLLSNMESGVVAVRDDGVVTTFNPAAERITGQPGAAVRGRPMAALPLALQGVLRRSLDGHPESGRELPMTRADGQPLSLVVYASALHDPTGPIHGAIAVLADHSRLKALEADQRRTERLAAVGAMAGGIAHEIRNPLVAIKTFAELLPERADEPEFRGAFARVARKEIERIEHLLGRLLILAEPPATPLRLVHLHEPLRETVDLVRGEAERRAVACVLDGEVDPPPVQGDPDQLKQLFLNLVMNGLEAMPDGGTLRITVGRERTRGEAGQITVRITDTGPGIPPGKLARIFEPFFTTKRNGTGLGLAICRRVADAHRAALWAEGVPGGLGTAFVVAFPAAAAVRTAEAVR